MSRHAHSVSAVPWVVPSSPLSPNSQDYLHYTHRVECPVKCLEQRLFVRISAAPYNCREDYEALARAVLAYPGPGKSPLSE